MPGESYVMDKRPSQPDPDGPHGKPLVVAVWPYDHEKAGLELAIDTGLWGEVVMNQQTMAPEYVLPFATWQDAAACLEAVLTQIRAEVDNV